MSFSLKDKKTQNLIVGLFTLLFTLWLVMFAVPNIFVNLFDTLLGNLILIVFIFLAAMYNINLAVGLAVVFIILWRFSHMRIDGFII